MGTSAVVSASTSGMTLADLMEALSYSGVHLAEAISLKLIAAASFPSDGLKSQERCLATIEASLGLTTAVG